MPLTEKQFPFTEKYGLPASDFRSKGPTAEACKRAMGHLKLMPWREYDQHWNETLSNAMATFKKSNGLTNDGSYGEGACEALRKATYKKDGKTLYALDEYACKLVQDEKGVTSTSDNEAKVQKKISEFGYAIIKNEANIGYNMNIRPYPVYVNPNSSYDSDCSMTVIQGYGYARHYLTDLKIPDPAKQGWSGYGNTDMYEDDHPKIGSPYRVGDLAHFHSSRHVILCIKAGDNKTAEWVSHGQESGPDLVKLSTYSRYPSEFMFVVRPPLLQK